MRYQKFSEFLKAENKRMESRYYIFDKERFCNICGVNNFTESFYYFNCGHIIHKTCLKSKIKELSFEKYQKITSAEEVREAKSAKFSEAKNAPNAHLRKDEVNALLQAFKEASKAVDTLYVEECLLCGDIIIDWAFQPFQNNDNLFNTE